MGEKRTDKIKTVCKNGKRRKGYHELNFILKQNMFKFHFYKEKRNYALFIVDTPTGRFMSDKLCHLFQ